MNEVWGIIGGFTTGSRGGNKKDLEIGEKRLHHYWQEQDWNKVILNENIKIWALINSYRLYRNLNKIL